MIHMALYLMSVSVFFFSFLPPPPPPQSDGLEQHTTGIRLHPHTSSRLDTVVGGMVAAARRRGRACDSSAHRLHGPQLWPVVV